jgi:arylsulfatase A-like enzyme/Flp pilus assembly protein TadD
MLGGVMGPSHRIDMREGVLSPLVLILVGLASPAWGGAPAAAPPAGAPNVLLVTVDTLRPDALGWAGAAHPTPAIDALARGGSRFPAAVAPVPLTLPSHASILTGLVPRRHGVRDNGQVLPPGPPTLAERLAAAGWTTAAFVSGFPVARAFGLDRGFATYDDDLPDGEEGRAERGATATARAAAEWLARAASPWLLWVHFYDPHHPYEPPPAFRRPGPRGTYDGEVAHVDRAVGVLLAAAAGAAAPAGEGRPLLTIFTADHGEALGEHGEATHGFFVYDSTVLVPLVVHWPGRVAAGESRAPARLVDLAPTVLDLLGLPPLPAVDGVSLAPLLAGRPFTVPPAYVETWQPWTSYGWAPLAALREARWKLISAPRPELYDLAADPAEAANLVDRERREARRLATALRAVEAAPPAAAAAPADDPEAAAKLRALGYLGGGTVRGVPPPGLADPKDRVALRDRLTRGEERMLAGDPRGALAEFEAVAAADPGNRFAWFRAGAALLALGDAPAAAARLERAVALDPGQGEARVALAQALTRARRFPDAVAQWLEAASLQPRRPEVWAGLGNALGLAGRTAEAVDALGHAAGLAPDDTALQVRLAFAEHAAGRPEAAARRLEEAAAAWRDGPFPHAGALGVLLFDLGRGDAARPWLERSRPGEGDYPEARLRLARLALAAGDRAAARTLLGEALSHAPRLRPRVEADPTLGPLLAGPR